MPSGADLPRLLIVRERDVGLFSMVQQVLYTLHLLEADRIDRIPVVLLGRGLLYFEPCGYAGRRNVWEYYFEPLVEGVEEDPVLSLLGERAFELLESKRKELELQRGAMDFAQHLHRLPPLDAEDHSNLAELAARVSVRDWAWTEAFLPTIEGRKAARRPLAPERGRSLIRRYVKPRSYIQRRVDELHASRLAGHYVIGVHVRGTDGYGAPARGVEISFDRYFDVIEERMAAVGPDRCRVFLATDEEAVVSRFEARLGARLVYCDTHRKVDGDPVFGTGPTGQVMPGYLATADAWPARNGEEAVLEYALLARSDLLVHNLSSLSQVARFSVPESVRIPGVRRSALPA